MTGSSPEDGNERTSSEDEASAEGKPLPTWNRSRTKRKKGESAVEDDAFQRGMREGSNVAKSRWQLLAVAGVAAVALLAGGLFAVGESNESAAKQTRDLAKASAVIGRGVVVDEDQLPADLSRMTPDPLFTSNEAKQEAYENYLAELERSDGGAPVLTLMLRAAEQLRVGDADAAVASYDAFMAEAGDSHPLFFLALEGKGIALENGGKLEEALAVYERLAGRKGTFYRDLALWHQGRTLEALDRVEDARGVYRTYIEEFPAEVSSLAREQVRERLEQLDPRALEVSPPAATASPSDDSANPDEASAQQVGE